MLSRNAIDIKYFTLYIRVNYFILLNTVALSIHIKGNFISRREKWNIITILIINI